MRSILSETRSFTLIRYTIRGAGIAGLVIASLRSQSPCNKDCGTGSIYQTWERDCGSDPYLFTCFTTECSGHALNCGYTDNYNDWCDGNFYCNNTGGGGGGGT